MELYWEKTREKDMKISLLRLLGLCAACMIIVDAGSYYQASAVHAGLGQGYILAALVELFLAITISVRLKGILANLIVCLLTSLLFLLAVTASTVTTALPAWEKINSIQTKDRMAIILNDGLDQEKKNTTYMRENRQSTNLAIAVKSQRRQRAKLVEVISTATKSELHYWVHFVIAIGLKITLQLANLWLFWLAGYYQRQQLINAETFKNQVLTQENEALTDSKEVLTETSKPSTLKTLIQNPKKLMKQFSLTPKLIADELGISRSAVSNVVNHYSSVMRYLLQLEKA